MLPYFLYPKVATHCKEQNKRKNHENWFKKTETLFKVIKCRKNAHKLKIFSLKILEF